MIADVVGDEPVQKRVQIRARIGTANAVMIARLRPEVQCADYQQLGDDPVDQELHQQPEVPEERNRTQPKSHHQIVLGKIAIVVNVGADGSHMVDSHDAAQRSAEKQPERARSTERLICRRQAPGLVLLQDVIVIIRQRHAVVFQVITAITAEYVKERP